jgi:hypothetical protein
MRLQLAPQLKMIDDFAIADDRVAPVGAGDWLLPAFDVDDAEATHPETEVTVDQIAVIIRAAVNQPLALARDHVPLNRAASSSVPACNAAHIPIHGKHAGMTRT